MPTELKRGMEEKAPKVGFSFRVTQNAGGEIECSLATEEISPRTLEADPPLVSRMITVFSFAWSFNSPVHPGGAYMTDMSGDGRLEKPFLRMHGRS